MKRINRVVRTVRNGRVKIFGRTFVPLQVHRSYDGRLDGKRIAFGLYWLGKRWQSDFVNCWGSEEMYLAGKRSINDNHLAFEAAYRANPCLVDGTFPWEFWDNVDRKHDKSI